MDERRLTQLLQMAAEAERMETGRSLLDSAPPVFTRRLWTPRPWIGVAAALGVAGVIGWALMPGGSQPTPRVASTNSAIDSNPAATHSGRTPSEPVVDVASAAAPDPCATESTILMALFQSVNGAVRSTRVAISDWDSRRGLDDMGEGEILSLAFEHIDEITAETLPDKVVLVAVSGPSGLLPDSEGDARVLQACLEGAPCGGDQSICYTSAAQQCLPDGLSVAVETRAMR
jgi:hypothetical protein